MTELKETYSLVSNTTGQIVIPNFKVETLEDATRKGRYAKKSKEDESFKTKQDEYLGNFVFFLYQNIEQLTCNLNDSELVKFIYTGTFVKPDGYLKLENNFTYINKARLMQLLNVSKKSFNSLYTKFLELQLLQEDNKGNIQINLSFFYKGTKTKYKKYTDAKLENFSKIYIEATRNLYMDTEPRQHNKLAIIYKLFPYVNWRYNVLCRNPNEVEESLVDIITINELVDILQYDKSHLKRFSDSLTNMRLANGKRVFGVFVTDSNFYNNPIYLNPLVCFRSMDEKRLDDLIKMFELVPRKTIK